MTGMVIIGGGMAGARACINLRANDYAGPITLITEEAFLPYDRPPLSKAAIAADKLEPPAFLLDEGIVSSLKVDVKLSCAAISINRAARTVALSDGSVIAYEKLLIATGAKPRQLTCPGGERAVTLRDYPDMVALRDRFLPDKRVAIIGGGFIGLELASTAAKRGCSVTLIEAQPRILMRGVPEEVARIVHERHVKAGVTMLVGTGISAISAAGVTLADGRMIPADTVIAGIGAAPEIRLAAEAGLAIDNGIACDARMQTSDPHVFAAGDCCSFINDALGGKRIRLEAWRSAQEQAATAVANMLGGDRKNATIPWFWSDQYDLSLQIVGSMDPSGKTVSRTAADGALVLFHLDATGKLVGASGIGIGNAIGRDIKMVEMMINKAISPAAEILADPTVQLKSLLKP